MFPQREQPEKGHVLVFPEKEGFLCERDAS